MYETPLFYSDKPWPTTVHINIFIRGISHLIILEQTQKQKHSLLPKQRCFYFAVIRENLLWAVDLHQTRWRSGRVFILAVCLSVHGL
jgi:hypothetical protein